MLRDLKSNEKFKEKVYVGLLTSVQIFNILDFVIILPMGPILMRYFNISPIQFATLASSYSLSSAVVSLLYSSFADKFERKNFLNLMFFGFIVATLICAMAPSYYFFLIARVIAGIFGGILTPCIYAIIADLIPFNRRGRALGTVMASFSITSVLGIPTGLWIADTYGWRHSFHFIGAGASAVFLINIFLLPKMPVPEFNLKPKEIFKRILTIALSSQYRTSFISMFCLAFSGFLLFPFFAVYAVKNAGITEGELKYIYLVGGIFTIGMSRLIGSLTDKYGSIRIFIPALLLSFISIYLYTTSGKVSLTHLLVLSTAFMLLVNARFVPAMKLITESPSDSDRGSFMGVLMSVRNGASAAGPIVSGFFLIETETELIHYDQVGYLSIIIGLISIYFVLKLNTQIREKNASST